MNSQLRKRLEAGKRAVLAQTGLLQRGFRRAKSTWKSDGTRVTIDLDKDEWQVEPALPVFATGGK